MAISSRISVTKITTIVNRSACLFRCATAILAAAPVRFHCAQAQNEETVSLS
jgi:hypothetical protein